MKKLFLALLLFPAVIAQAYDSVQLRRTVTAPADLKGFAPGAAAFDPAGRLWVVDQGRHQLQLFSADGVWQKSVGRRGAALGDFSEPGALAIDAAGRIYVADAGNHRIQVLSADGAPLFAFGEKGAGPGQVKEPAALAVSADGVLAVADAKSERLQLFTADGIFLREFVTTSPIDALAMDRSGRIAVVHEKAGHVEQWSAAGQLVKTWTGGEPGVKALDAPAAVAVSGTGLLYVADRNARQFREMDAGGHTLGLFGRAGTGDGQFKSMDGIAVRGNEVVISDARNRRLVWLSLVRPALPALMAAPATRLQIQRKALLPFDVDRLAPANDGSWSAIHFERGELLSWDAAGTSTSTIDVRKTLGVKTPSGLGVAPASGSLFIADAGRDRVLKIDRAGKLLLDIGKADRKFKRGEGDLSSPQGVACSPQGLLLVADGGSGRLQAFNHQGLFQFAAGERGSGMGQIKTPVAVAWDKDAFYVVDAGNEKVAMFSATGRFLHEMRSAGPEPLQSPRQVAVDREGNVFVLDSARSRIAVFDPQGTFIGALGAPGRSPGFLWRPRGLAISDTGDLAVAEEGRVQIFRVAVLPSAPANLVATPGEGFVALRWDPVTTRYPAKYAVYRSSPGVEAERIQETLETSAHDDALPAGTTVQYTIVAQSAQGVPGAPSVAVPAMAKAISGPRLEIVSSHIDDVFSAHYKVYGREPLGRVVIRNNGEAPVQKLKVSFAIQGYMDYPTETTVAGLRSQEEKDVPLLATFNNRILEVTETTPMQAQVKLSYMSGEQEKSVERNLPFKLYSRNSIRWADKESVTAFVTPNDPAVLDFSRKIVTAFAENHRGAPVPAELMTAWALFSGLGTYGMTYLPRPNNPYDQASLSTGTVDTMQFARETLSRKSGDCADVVALLASALESMTVTTAVLDAPGHLFLMFDTGESSVQKLGFPAEWLVSYAGTYWIPLEATMLGQPFLDAWKQGAEEYRRFAAQGQVTPIDVHQAWKRFEPATLPEQASSVLPPSREAVEAKFLADWKALVDLRWRSALEGLKDNGTMTPAASLQAGLLAIEFRRYDEATAFFLKAAEDPSSDAAAYNNLGNLAYLKGDAASAEQHYRRAFDKDAKDAQVALNLARVYQKLQRPEQASKAFEQAMALDPSLREVYPDVSVLAPQ